MSRFRAYRGLLAVIAVVAVVAVVLIATGGDDDADEAASGGGSTEEGGGDDDGEDEAEFPGIGSDAALENSQCDPETGLVKIPSFRSPPCVKEWPAGEDNGGATASGVTADAIKVVVRLSPTTEPEVDELTKKESQAAVDMVADHLELWGRKIELVFHKATGADEAAQRADATAIANDIKPFAALSNSSTGAVPTWEAELAARKILVMGWDQTWADQQAQAPYRWSFFMDDKVRMAHVAEYIGKRLWGHPAKWAGDADLQAADRKFALIYPEDSTLDIDFFREQLTEYDAELAEVIGYPADGNAQATQARTAISRMKEAGITTVISFAQFGYGSTITNQAQNDGYSPEWFLTGYASSDTNVLGRAMNQEQFKHAFAIGGINLQIKGISNFNTLIYNWHHGRDPAPDAAAQMGTFFTPAQYLFNGFHLAGPDLTVESFKKGMFGWKAFGGSWTDSKVEIGFSFGDQLGVDWDDYSGQDDMAEKWYDPATVGVDEIGREGPGMWWQLNDGKRYRVGDWPDGEPAFFSQDGARINFDGFPDGDAPPDYPHEPKGS